MCDLGYLIRDHIPSVIQALSIDLHSYKIPLQPTRCFYTAILIMYLLLGVDSLNGLGDCNTDAILSRFSKSQTGSFDVATSLTNEMFDKSGDHTLFYILISNYESPKDSNGVSRFFFPGHVFVVERTPVRHTDRIPKFNIYQSYVGNYTLDTYVTDAKSLSVGATKMKRFMNSLCQMMQTMKWDEQTSQFWSEFTHTPIEHARQFVDLVIPHNILLCYKISQVEDCNKKLREFLNRHIGILRKLKGSSIYGVHNDTENNEVAPLTVSEMLIHFLDIKDKID